MTPLCSREDIRRVVVILAGSRTGSSFLFSALKAKADFLSPTGEETPFYRLAGLGRFNGPTYSDTISNMPDEGTCNAAFRALAPDLGISHSLCLNRDELGDAFFARLALQWPGLIGPATKIRLKSELLTELSELPGDWTDWHSIYLRWINKLKAKGFALSEAPYSASAPFHGSPSLLEESPYISPEPKIQLTDEMARTYPLLLKTSTNVYRTDFLRRLFPRAQFKWIVLRRNPASTVSALMDGWLSGGFHSHDVSPHLNLKIRGYTNAVSGGERYWKFDMPPGWQNLTQATLTEVCAFQWLSAYQAIESFRKTMQDPTFDISYEDLISPTAPELFQKLIQFAGAKVKMESVWKSDQPVAAVAPPARGKWKKRATEIVPVLQQHHGGLILDMAGKLNYDQAQLDSWP